MKIKWGIASWVTLVIVWCELFSTIYADVKLYVYPKAGVQSIVTMIHQARNTIDIVMYGFTDKRILSALIDAHDRGVKERILLQHKPYKAEYENTAIVRRLRSAGISVKWSNPQFDITHQKTMVVDNQYAFIMTFNFTYPTFENTRNFAIKTSDSQQVQEIVAVFNADWNRTPAPDLNNANLVWSPNNAQQKIIGFIDHAKKSLLVYNQEVAQQAVIEALVRAAKRHVEVNCIVPQSTAHQYCQHLSYLVRHGVRVRLDGQLYIHAKAMVADEAMAKPAVFVGSTNFSEYAINKNRELGIITHNALVAKQLKHTFNQDWRASITLQSKCDVAAE